MSVQNSKKEKNQYYNISESDLKNGIIRVKPLKDGRNVYVLEYGENKSDIAVIALATIDTSKDNMKTRENLKKVILSLKSNPNMRDLARLNDIEDTYSKKGFEWTPEGKKILSQEIDKVMEQSIPKTVNVKYNPVGKAELEYIDVNDSEIEMHKNFVKLESVLNGMSKTDLKIFSVGKNIFFKMVGMNSKHIPENYEEAKEWLAQDDFSEIEMINFMKENNPEEYREVFELKEAALIREKWKNVKAIEDGKDVMPSEDLISYLQYNQIVDDYILENGDQDKNNIKDKNIKKVQDDLNILIENYDIQEERLFMKEVSKLLPIADIMKTRMFNENEQEINYFLNTMQQSGFEIGYSKIADNDFIKQNEKLNFEKDERE